MSERMYKAKLEKISDSNNAHINESNTYRLQKAKAIIKDSGDIVEQKKKWDNFTLYYYNKLISMKSLTDTWSNNAFGEDWTMQNGRFKRRTFDGLAFIMGMEKALSEYGKKGKDGTVISFEAMLVQNYKQKVDNEGRKLFPKRLYNYTYFDGKKYRVVSDRTVEIIHKIAKKVGEVYKIKPGEEFVWDDIMTNYCRDELLNEKVPVNQKDFCIDQVKELCRSGKLIGNVPIIQYEDGNYNIDTINLCNNDMEDEYDISRFDVFIANTIEKYYELFDAFGRKTEDSAVKKREIAKTLITRMYLLMLKTCPIEPNNYRPEDVENCVGQLGLGIYSNTPAGNEEIYKKLEPYDNLLMNEIFKEKYLEKAFNCIPGDLFYVYYSVLSKSFSFIFSVVEDVLEVSHSTLNAKKCMSWVYSLFSENVNFERLCSGNPFGRNRNSTSNQQNNTQSGVVPNP